MKILTAAAAALLCATVAVAQPRPAPKKPNACDLITKAEVAAALQQPVASEPTAGGMGPMATCAFVIGGALHGLWNLQQMACSPEGFKELAGIAGAKPQSIAGVGDQASWDGDTLTIRKGGQCLMVPGWDGPRSLEVAKDLGGKAAGRLPK